MTSSNSERFDYIIVGGGSAGCVMANRLSADSQVRVLLIEAGPDFEPGKEPAPLRDRGARTFMLANYFWPDLMDDQGTRRIPIAQARVMGGGSSINGMHAQRGLPRDYEEWRQFGVEGWGWQDLLPYFCKLENDVDFPGPMHGKSGPVVIRRVPEESWSPLTLALRKALESRGIPRLRDINTDGGDGTAATPLNNSSEARLSASIAYLTSDVRARTNLRIMPDTKVAKIKFEGRQALGVEIEGGRVLSAAHVIVSAGAIHSPALLLRSGVGPGNELQGSGIPVVADRPGVGRNLMNHPYLNIFCHLRRSGRQHAYRTVRPPVPMIVRYSSNLPTESTDMMLNLWERMPGPLEDDPLGRQFAWLMALLNKSHSRGTVRLNPSDPQGPLNINANILSDARDLERMVGAFRMMCDMLTQDPLSSLVNHCFIPNMAMGMMPDSLTMALLQDNPRAHLISTAGALGLDWIPGLRHRYLRKAGRDIASILAAQDKLPEFLRSITAMGGHPAGTCRLGSARQLDAVVDSRCRVIGVDNLRVADASIFPTLMTAGTNLPSMMVGEKCAEMMLQDRRSAGRPTVVASEA